MMPRKNVCESGGGRGPSFYELPLHFQIIELQRRGLTLREAARNLGYPYGRVTASINAWLIG